MFGPNALWHSLAGRVSEESGKGQEQQERERRRETTGVTERKKKHKEEGMYNQEKQ